MLKKKFLDFWENNTDSSSKVFDDKVIFNFQEKKIFGLNELIQFRNKLFDGRKILKIVPLVNIEEDNYGHLFFHWVSDYWQPDVKGEIRCSNTCYFTYKFSQEKIAEIWASNNEFLFLIDNISPSLSLCSYLRNMKSSLYVQNHDFINIAKDTKTFWMANQIERIQNSLTNGSDYSQITSCLDENIKYYYDNLFSGEGLILWKTFALTAQLFHKFNNSKFYRMLHIRNGSWLHSFTFWKGDYFDTPLTYVKSYFNSENKISHIYTSKTHYTYMFGLNFQQEFFNNRISYLFKNPSIIKGEVLKLNKSKKITNKVDNISDNKLRKIAIVGMAGQFASSNSLFDFWTRLKDGERMISKIPKNRSYLKAGNKIEYAGFMNNVDLFDAQFFKKSPAESEYIDPQKRKLFEIIWKAIEDAGYDIRQFKTKKTGVFVAKLNNDYEKYLQLVEAQMNFHYMLGNAESAYSGDISNFLNLTGPSKTINAECSGSLYAIHEACQSIRSGEIEQAIVAASNMILHPYSFNYREEPLLTNKSNSYILDKKSEGQIRGEGVACVILKSLDKAEADNDKILASIRGSAVNNSGNFNPYSNDFVVQQSEVIKSAWESSMINPNDIDYIELHASGVKRDDFVEVSALKSVFSNEKRSRPCYLGSVKSAIGHLEPVSGLASLIKVIFQINKNYLIGIQNLDELDPILGIEKSFLKPVFNNTSWFNHTEKPRLVGINNFAGFGHNAHIVIEEYYKKTDSYKFFKKESNSNTVITLSAIDKLSLNKQVENLLEFIKHPDNDHIELHSLSYTLNIGRMSMKERFAFVASNMNDVVMKLSKFLKLIDNNKYNFLDVKNKEGDDYDVEFILAKKNRSVSDLEKLAAQWINGQEIDWNKFYSDENRPSKIDLPTYEFSGNSYWFKKENNRLNSFNDKEVIFNEENNQEINIKEDPVFNSNSNNQSLKEYISTVFAEVLKVQKSKLNFDTYIGDYGIDSFLITKLMDKLSETFTKLEKVAFFELKTLNDFVEYLNLEHKEDCIKLFTKDASLDSKNNDFQLLENSRLSSEMEKKELLEIENSNKIDAIAIIGLSGRYPDAANTSVFWENLKAGKESIKVIPKTRWDWSKNFCDSREKAKELNKNYCKYGGFLNDIDCFDPLFFKMSPKEASLLDPQERLFLMQCWKVIEDAGYSISRLKSNAKKNNGDIGVFGGITVNDYYLNDPENISASIHANLTNRVSYAFDFLGPSIPIDTMCSSSITAIDLACDYLKRNQCVFAIAGAVNLYTHPNSFRIRSQLNMFSDSGHNESFGAGANGFIPGEGVGAILLKPLSLAKKDGDFIYGVIKGTAVNHGGNTSGYTVPSPIAQASVIRKALDKSNVSSRSISYFEAHGTGTALGDPIEILGISKAYKVDTNDKQFCRIGSVKSNIGHLEAASGLAGLTKIILQFTNKKIVPTLHAVPTNNNIDTINSPITINHKLVDWIPKSDEQVPRRAALSSFGAGGANAHLILEEFTNELDMIKNSKINKYFLFILSANHLDSLSEYVSNVLNYLLKNDDLDMNRFCYSFQLGRKSMKYRLAIIFKTRNELIGILKSYANTNVQKDFFYGEIDTSLSNKNRKQVKLSFLNNNLKKKDLKNIANSWVSGDEIDWEKFYYGQNLVVLPFLPTYPFLRTKCWVSNLKKITRKSSYNDKVKKTIQQSSALEYVMTIFEDVLGISKDQLDCKASLDTYGVDSIIMISVENKLKKISSKISVDLLLSMSSIEDIANCIDIDYRNSKFSSKNKKEIIFEDFQGIKCLKKSDNIRYRLLLTFPLGFGEKSFAWVNKLSKNIEVWTVGTTTKRTCKSKSIFLANQIKHLFDRPVIFFGHSLGALIAYETVAFLERKYKLFPAELILSCCHPPKTIEGFKHKGILKKAEQTKNTKQKLNLLIENRFIFDRQSGIPMISNSAILNDLNILKKYKFDNFVLDSPLQIIYALDDIMIGNKLILNDWAKTSKNFKGLVSIKGDHLYFRSPPNSFIELLNNKLLKKNNGNV